MGKGADECVKSSMIWIRKRSSRLSRFLSNAARRRSLATKMKRASSSFDFDTCFMTSNASNAGDNPVQPTCNECAVISTWPSQNIHRHPKKSLRLLRNLGLVQLVLVLPSNLLRHGNVQQPIHIHDPRRLARVAYQLSEPWPQLGVFRRGCAQQVDVIVSL